MFNDTDTKQLIIGFFGGGSQALACLGRISATEGLSVAFVHLRDPQDLPLRQFCADRKIDILDARDVNAMDVVARIREIGIDLIVSVNAKQIFHPSLLSIPTHGALNVHNGMLPKQRGGGGAYTAIINGETPGTTVHYIDAGIDTGDIVVQRAIPLGPDETMGDFQRKAIAASADVLLEALEGIRTGTAMRTPQRTAPFHYTPRKPTWDELVDWSQTSRMILDKVRARTPGPANFYIHGDDLIEIVKVTAEPALLSFFNTVGQVLQRHPDKGVLVKTGDSGVWVNLVRKKGEDREFVPKHPPGTMLRYMLDHEIYEIKARLAALEAKAETGR